MRLYKIGLLLLFLSACEGSDQNSEAVPDEKVSTMFYCYLTAYSAEIEVGINHEEADLIYFERLRKESFRLSADRFCDTNLVDYMVCLSPDVRVKDEPFEKYCPRPTDLINERMDECSAKMTEYFGTTVSKHVEEMGVELGELSKQTNLADEIFMIMALPGLDMFRLFIIRIYNGKHPFSPDMRHVHHLFLKYYTSTTTFIVIFLYILVTTLLYFYVDFKLEYLIIYLLLYLLIIFLLTKKIKN